MNVKGGGNKWRERKKNLKISKRANLTKSKQITKTSLKEREPISFARASPTRLFINRSVRRIRRMLWAYDSVACIFFFFQRKNSWMVTKTRVNLWNVNQMPIKKGIYTTKMITLIFLRHFFFIYFMLSSLHSIFESKEQHREKM